MKLENQVVSLGIAKRLKELGVKQESEFYWWENVLGCGSPDNPYRETGVFILRDKENIHFHPFDKCYSAYTVAELGELLIPGVNKHGDEYHIETINWGDRYSCYYTGNNVWDKYEEAHTEADARGKMLQYLLENNLIPRVHGGERE